MKIGVTQTTITIHCSLKVPLKVHGQGDDKKRLIGEPRSRGGVSAAMGSKARQSSVRGGADEVECEEKLGRAQLGQEVGW